MKNSDIIDQKSENSQLQLQDIAENSQNKNKNDLFQSQYDQFINLQQKQRNENLTTELNLIQLDLQNDVEQKIDQLKLELQSVIQQNENLNNQIKAKSKSLKQIQIVKEDNRKRQSMLDLMVFFVVMALSFVAGTMVLGHIL